MKETCEVTVCVVLVALVAATGCRRHRESEPFAPAPAKAAPHPEPEKAEPEKKDLFGGPDLAEEGSPLGALQRFLEAWKRGDVDLLLTQCRAGDKTRRELLDRYEKTRLSDYTIGNWERTGAADVLEVEVTLSGRDMPMKTPKLGMMKPRLYPERTPAGEQVYRVDLTSAAPQWVD